MSYLRLLLQQLRYTTIIIRVRVLDDINGALSLGKYLMNVSSVFFSPRRCDGTRTDDEPPSSLQGIEFRTRHNEREEIAIPHSAMFAIPGTYTKVVRLRSVNGKESPHLII